ncbi:MAG: DUF1573 domain-containing protein [Phycisphaerae bacterium]|nr:DUF1573 domain-containing protein [Phycisphaerae bacterium]
MNHTFRRRRCVSALRNLTAMIAVLAAAQCVEAQQPTQPAGAKAVAPPHPPKNSPTRASTSVVGPSAPAATSEFVGPPYDQVDSARAVAGQPANPAAIKSGKVVPNVPAPTVQLKPGEVPAIRFDTPTYDFGSTRAGPDIQHEFWFTNTGNGPLEILSVKPS